MEHATVHPITSSSSDRPPPAVQPATWRHADYVSEINARLRTLVQKRKSGKVLVGEVGIYTRREAPLVRSADVVFISNERLAKVASADYLDVAPELVVEVIGEGGTWRELREKIDEFFAVGVERIWIVEPDRRGVFVYRAPETVKVLHEDDELRGEGALEGFVLKLSDLFER